MPTENETLPAEPATPVEVPTETERMDAVFESATKEAETQEPVAASAEEEPAVVAAAEEPAPVVTDPVEPPAEPIELTPEQQDEVDAKALGFKNQRANTEFKTMRAELRELRPLKEKLPELEAHAGRWGEVYGFLRQNEITPERFKQGMTMTAALSSKDPKVLAQAREGLEWELRQLNEKLGIAGNGYDPLAEPTNSDLAEAVRNEEMTADRAQQVARERKEAAHYRQSFQQTQEQTQTATARQAAVQRAGVDLDALQDKYQSIDPRFQEKAAILVPTLKAMFEDIPPERWAAKFEAAYLALQLPAAPAAPAQSARPAPLRNQPMRASSIPPAGVAAALKTPDEIIQAAIDSAAELDRVPSRP